ncbi:Zn-ribbon domain-containing OB-fold protein [Ramlibacter sp.]|uniref:Zn-ribbon domain-containing OB-fold protein n=1 Tax=Ramlibacter sp. TaxID=1917967 RepID=UPI0035AFA4E5
MPTFETQAYWDAVDRQELLVKTCKACGQAHYTPRSHCPHCFSSDTHWQPASGRAVVYSYAIANRADPPYVVAYVQLAEGPMMLANIVACAPADVHIGQAVQVIFQPDAEGRTRPYFQPTPKDAA